MDSFILGVSVVTPLFIYMVIGGMIKKLHIFSYDNFKALNGLVFNLMIPLALFFDVYNARLTEAVKPKLFLYVEICIFAIFLVAWIVMSKWVPENADASVMIQGTYRSNYVLFGSAIAARLCSEAGNATVAALAAMVVPTYNVLAVFLFEAKRGGKVDFRDTFINILKNPLVEAGVLGIVFNLLHIQIPAVVAEPLQSLGNSATPVALVALGGMLSFGSLIKHKKYLAVVTLFRLILVPFAVIFVSVLLGFRGDVLVAILAIFGAPTAVASGPMAQTMGGNGELAGEIVAVTTAGAILTIFLFVFALSGMGLL